MDETRLLLVEDDTRLAEMLTTYLGENGCRVHHESTVRGGWEAVSRSTPDAILLDVMLPDGDGLELCRRIRAASDVPIVMLTARGDETDRIVGLELGADDYLPKPFNPRELLARIRAVLRRAALAPVRVGEVLRFGALEIDRGQRVARLGGEPCDLTGLQFQILDALAERAGRALSREQISEAVRGEEYGPFDRSIDVHVSRIRAAIEDDPKRPRRIQTVRGVGYLFARLAGDEGGL